MTLSLPRPAPKLSHMDRLVLDLILTATKEGNGIAPRSLIVSGSLPKETIEQHMMSLVRSGHILLTISHVAFLSRVRTELKKESDKNRNRVARKVSPTWHYRSMVAEHFPFVVKKRQLSRPGGYRVPTAFKPLIEDPARKSAHRKNRPADVEEFAGPYYPGDLHALLQVEEEQKAAHREVWILFTRKAAYLGVKRKRHTPI